MRKRSHHNPAPPGETAEELEPAPKRWKADGAPGDTRSIQGALATTAGPEEPSATGTGGTPPATDGAVSISPAPAGHAEPAGAAAPPAGMDAVVGIWRHLRRAIGGIVTSVHPSQAAAAPDDGLQQMHADSQSPVSGVSGASQVVTSPPGGNGVSSPERLGSADPFQGAQQPGPAETVTPGAAETRATTTTTTTTTAAPLGVEHASPGIGYHLADQRDSQHRYHVTLSSSGSSPGGGSGHESGPRPLPIPVPPSPSFQLQSAPLDCALPQTPSLFPPATAAYQRPMHHVVDRPGFHPALPAHLAAFPQAAAAAVAGRPAPPPLPGALHPAYYHSYLPSFVAPMGLTAYPESHLGGAGAPSVMASAPADDRPQLRLAQPSPQRPGPMGAGFLGGRETNGIEPPRRRSSPYPRNIPPVSPEPLEEEPPATECVPHASSGSGSSSEDGQRLSANQAASSQGRPPSHAEYEPQSDPGTTGSLPSTLVRGPGRWLNFVFAAIPRALQVSIGTMFHRRDTSSGSPESELSPAAQSPPPHTPRAKPINLKPCLKKDTTASRVPPGSPSRRRRLCWRDEVVHGAPLFDFLDELPSVPPSGLTRTASLELSPFRQRVLAMCPHWVREALSDPQQRGWFIFVCMFLIAFIAQSLLI